MIRLLQFCLAVTLTLLCFVATAQRKDISISQADPRFTISAQRHYGFGNEEYWFYIQNNTNEEYELVVNVTIRSTCHEPKNFMLGVNKVVRLKPKGRFTPDADWSHIYLGGEAQKACRKKDGDSYTYLAGISYQYQSIKNITQENLRKEQEKKKLEAQKAEDARKAEEAKKAEAARKAEEVRKREETLKAEQAAKEKQQKLAQEEAQRKQAASTTASGTATTGTTGTGTTKSATGTTPQGNKLTSSQTSNATTATETKTQEQRQAEYEESQRLAREAAAQQAKARQEAEEREATERQQKYDEWKAKKDQDRQTMEATSLAASASALYFLGGIIYDGMGNYNPDFAYQQAKPDEKYKPVLYAGFEVGYGASYFPVLFASSQSTMVKGKYVEQKSLITKDVITVNLNGAMKIGAEADNYGARAFLIPQVGFSPIFDAYMLSLLNGGIKVYGGLPWIKGYFEFRSGERNFYTYSLDAEEYGEGNSDNGYNRFEYGIRFTTNPDSDFRRSHISLGIISEKMNVGGIGKYVDPETNTLRDGKTPPIKGYSFSWHKDHTFNLYLNAFPAYIYSGDVSYNSGPLNVSKGYNTSTFVELGFIRAFDMFSTR